MPRAATEVMQSILFSAVLDAIAALKASSKGLPNQLVRDLQAIHPNTTFADLPKELQDAIATNTRAAFTQLLKEGYSVASRDAAPVQPRPPVRHGAGERRGPAPDRRPRRTGGPPRGPNGDGPGKGPGAGPGNRPGQGPGKGPGPGARRPRPPKGKPRLS